MKVLIDECVPKALKAFLTNYGHECQTVQEAGWACRENGDLLAAAEKKFDVLVTIDTNLHYQQNLAGRTIAIVIVQSSSNRIEHLRPYFPACAGAIERIKPGEVVKVGSSASN